jgi:YegS/Rv2252/BmrU family lipid kinase
MQARHIMAEVFIVQPDSDVGAIVRRAIDDGTRLIVVSGGDGTVDTVAHAMTGTPVKLGIIPTGTRNNLALNLGIPLDIPGAVALLREGTPLRIDVGRATSEGNTRYFLELVTIGLLSDIYPLADDFQHGDLTRLGELLNTFVSATPSQAKLTLDRARKVGATGHVVLVANMPFIGPNLQIDPNVSFRDGLLDVFVVSDMNKLLLLNFALRTLAGNVDQAAIRHFQVKQLKLSSEPAMSVMADGAQLGSGTAKIEILPEALTVMAGSTRGRGPTKEELERRRLSNG